MVQIIENPAYTGGPVDPTGQNLAGALNGIAGAFLNTGRGDLVRAQFMAAQQQEAQKQAAIGTVADVFGKYLGQNADYAQDYAQDAPDYSAQQPYQQPPFQFNPSQFSQAALQSGVDLGQIGKTLQLSSAIQGGPNAPGVVTGAIPANTVKETPQYIEQAAAAEASKPETLSQGAQLRSKTGELIAENPKEATTPYNIAWQDAAGNRHSMVSSDPVKDIANADIGQFNPVVTSGGGAASREHVVGQNLVDASGKVLFSASPQSTLDPAAIDLLAERSVKGDNSGLVGLGRGAQGAANLVAVQNRAAQIATEKGMDPQAVMDNIAEFGGVKAGARTLGTLNARLQAFSSEAAASADLALEKSAAVPRTIWMPVNKLMQLGQEASSNRPLAEFQASINAFVNLYAKAVNPNGMPTVESRNHAFSMLNQAQGPDAFAGVIDTLKREVNIAHNAVRGTVAAQRHGTLGPGEQSEIQNAPGKIIKTYNPATRAFE